MKHCNPITFATEKHKGQYRENGDEYIAHPLSTRETLKQLHLNGDILDAAVLHDVCEEAGVDFNEIQERFGEKIAFIVYCLSKTPKAQFQNSSNAMEERRDDYIEKLYIGAKVYPEIMLIKMSDQIDNMQSISVFRVTKQKRLLSDIQNKYLPLFESCIEDLSEEFQDTAVMLLNRLKENVYKEDARIASMSHTSLHQQKTKKLDQKVAHAAKVI